MKNNEQKLADMAQKQLSALRNSERHKNLEPSPFLKTRVLANVRAQNTEKSKSWLSWLKIIAPVMAVLIAIITIKSIQQSSENKVFQVGQPYMVRFDLRSLQVVEDNNSEIKFAEIVLKDNLRFSSKKFSEIKEVKKLTLAWESLVGKQYLPIVIEGLDSGEAEVIVYFYNEKKEVIEKKNMTLLFGQS